VTQFRSLGGNGRGVGGGELCHRHFHNKQEAALEALLLCGLLEREYCTMLLTLKVGFLFLSAPLYICDLTVLTVVQRI